MDDCQRRPGVDPRPEPSEFGKTHGMIDAVGRQAAAAAERDDRHADAARIDCGNNPFARGHDLADYGCMREVLVHALDEILGATEQRHHA